MFTITNEQLKKILGPAIYNWDTAFKNYDFIKMELGTSEDKKMLKISLKSKLLESYNENHFFEDYEEILKTIEEVLLFPAYEKYSDSKYHERIFKELDETFSFLGKKCTTYADYLRKTSKDAYIKIEIHELLKLLKRLTGQLVPEDLIGKIKQEASRREGYKLAVHFTRWASSEQDDRIIFTVLPNIFSRILTAHEHQEAIEDTLLEQSYKCNVIEKEKLFERIDDLNKVFKVKKDKKYFENKFDLINENFLVCPNENFLPKAGPLMCERAPEAPKVEITTFSPDFSFIWNQKPFDLAGFKFETMNEWEAYKSKKEVDEKFEQAENDGNKEKPKFEIGTFISPVMDNRSLKEIAEEIIKKGEEKPKIDISKWWEDAQERTQKFLKERKLDWIKPRIKEIWKPRSIYDIMWDEFTEEKTIKEAKGDKNNMNTNKNANIKLKPMRPDSIMFDEENKVIVAFLNNKKFKVVCDKDDKFDFRIGLGVVVSRMNDSNKELQYLRLTMNWKQYYLYCYNKFFYFNSDKIKAFENSVYAEKEQYKLKLDEEKVRKFRCEEVEFNIYKPKKITHDFILLNPQGK